MWHTVADEEFIRYCYDRGFSDASGGLPRTVEEGSVGHDPLILWGIDWDGEQQCRESYDRGYEAGTVERRSSS